MEEFQPISPTKKSEEFRDYATSARQEKVFAFYQKQHKNQTVEFNRKIREQFEGRPKISMGLWEMLRFLDDVEDSSDPDTNLSQMAHALQTAESVRRMFPEQKYDWFHLVGLIHDLGKVLTVTDEEKGFHALEQWAVAGDTFPVGCAFDESCVFHDLFRANPDFNDDRYSSKLGIYSDHCGLSNVMMSWGHDEYLYQVCVRNKCSLPRKALSIIRFHSFYPWHGKGAYKYLTDSSDAEALKWVKKFNEHDLYSKAHELPDFAILRDYYKTLIEKYFPEKLNW
uniref:Inositol oxygenase n=1 Tax=Hirondellea gigas TaxID=1518452 RepID=A0A6A7GDQ0_9CRUS